MAIFFGISSFTEPEIKTIIMSTVYQSKFDAEKKSMFRIHIDCTQGHAM